MVNKILVTGSSGHLGEALVRALQSSHEVVGLDIKPSPFTSVVGSVADRSCARRCLKGVHTVYHTATLHKPHVVTHSMSDFVGTNIQGTLVLLEEAVASGVNSFVFTSTTSVFGDALRPGPDAPAIWVTEEIVPVPRNIYGVTKAAAEDLCHLFHRNRGLDVVVLRTSRFFPEEDDNRAMRMAYADDNLKVNELLFRRADLEDIVSAHLKAGEHAPAIGFGRYIVSATTPFQKEDLVPLRAQAPEVVRKRAPEYEQIYRDRGWLMLNGIDRVYVNEAARKDLQWQPKYDFAYALSCLKEGKDPRSELAKAIGSKGYHSEKFEEGPYPVE